MLLRILNDEDLVRWLNSESKIKFTSPGIQNGILEIMGLQDLCEISRNKQRSAIYTDEASDISDKGQLVF